VQHKTREALAYVWAQMKQERQKLVGRVEVAQVELDEATAQLTELDERMAAIAADLELP
jgi:hypothetical protein